MMDPVENMMLSLSDFLIPFCLLIYCLGRFMRFILTCKMQCFLLVD